jgi:hypothetical protein
VTKSAGVAELVVLAELPDLLLPRCITVFWCV